MKFANYSFSARGVNNLGDNMQIIAIDEIYKTMGVELTEVSYINMHELATYSGDYVVLPVTMPLVDYVQGGLGERFSNRIIPVFLGLTLVRDTLLPEEIEYLKRFTPIGCRDERTLNTIRKYKIEAYLHGCITASLPLRKENKLEQTKIYLVDAPKGIEEYLPKEFHNNLVYKTHLHEGITNPKEMMQEYYTEYKENSLLMITSLLHCSMPCKAAGIPTVLVKEKFSYRFSWIEKLQNLYYPQELAHLDWNKALEISNYEDHKKTLLDFTIKRLKDVYEKNNDMLTLSYFYENRVKREYCNDACDSLLKFINDTWIDKNFDYKYSFFGLTQAAEFMHSYIQKNYPNAKLSHVYDTYRKQEFYGLISENPINIKEHIEETVLVATNGATQTAIKLFNEIGKDRDKYAFV